MSSTRTVALPLLDNAAVTPPALVPVSTYLKTYCQVSPVGTSMVAEPPPDVMVHSAVVLPLTQHENT